MGRPELKLPGMALGAVAALAVAAVTAADPVSGKLTFEALQAGPRFTGEFARFTADVAFDPADPAACRFEVGSDTAAPDTQELQGSDFQIGYQYAQQVMQIYGPWIMERKAGRVFSESELVHLRQWDQQLATYAPEIIPLCKGWAKGASDAGVRMSYEDVLEIWCSALPPETDYMGSGGARMEDVPPIGCSGVAAWGRATRDGCLVTGSAGDFDLTYTVTIVAFPESGNNYIFTPFGATGDVPGIGSVNMFGHPGMNNKGLAYVHHGGTPKMIEPKQYWGYGLRRTASVLHTLRFADNARQARDLELSYPIGDVGLDSGTVA